MSVLLATTLGARCFFPGRVPRGYRSCDRRPTSYQDLSVCFWAAGLGAKSCQHVAAACAENVVSSCGCEVAKLRHPTNAPKQLVARRGKEAHELNAKNVHHRNNVGQKFQNEK